MIKIKLEQIKGINIVKDNIQLFSKNTFETEYIINDTTEVKNVIIKISENIITKLNFTIGFG